MSPVGSVHIHDPHAEQRLKLVLYMSVVVKRRMNYRVARIFTYAGA